MKLKNLEHYIENTNSWTLSLSFHAFFGCLFMLALLPSLRLPRTEKIEFALIEKQEALNEAEIKHATLADTQKIQKSASSTSPISPVKTPTKPAEQVFGLNRKELSTEDSSVSVKSGNTLAKDFDNKTLKATDPDEIPADIGNPADEFMVTRMPVISFQFRIPYPEEARKKEKQGAVTVDLLVDKLGQVRKVKLISGPGFGLNEAAVEALTKFRFSPALLKTEPVPVWIRYSYKFVLGE